MTLAPSAGEAVEHSSIFDRLRALFPFRAVVLPWIVARLIVVPIVVTSAPGDRFYPGALLSMDGQWFRLIAIDGYDTPYVAGAWSEYPFFPLFPAIASVPMRLGVSDTVALAGVAWLASLVAFSGLYRLAVDHLNPAAARWSIWVVALAPGALSLVIGYADALFLAGIAWAFVAADSRRWLVAGVFAAIATASRPNGVLIVAALLLAILLARAGWRAALAVSLPSAAFLVAWGTYLQVHAGDAFVFWTAKDAWTELTIWDYLAVPFNDHLALAHVLVFVVAAIAYAARVRSQPLPWALFVAMVVVPPMFLGVVGLARYAVLAFPMQFALASVVTSRGRVWATVYVGASTVVLAVFAHRMVASAWVP